MGENDTEDLSIAGAVNSLADDLEKGEGSEGAGDGSSEDSKDGDTTPAEGDKKPEGEEGEETTGDDNKPEEEPKEGDKPAEGEDKKGEEGEGDKPKEGEYTKERFDGLMSAWQTDKTNFKETVDGLKQDVDTLKESIGNVTKKEGPEISDEDLPPEIQGSDEDTKRGFKALMKVLHGQGERMQKKILDNITEKLNEPLRKETEDATKANTEIKELSVKLGKEFSDNTKDILDFAVKNKYPLGTLEQAFSAWKTSKENDTLKDKSKKGKKTVEEIEEENKKNANLPGGGANRSQEVSKFDPEKDGNKTYSELFNEGFEK